MNLFTNGLNFKGIIFQDTILNISTIRWYGKINIGILEIKARGVNAR